MKKPKKTVAYKFNQVKEKLGLANWELHFAVEQGWITRNEKGEFNNKQIGALSKNPQNLQNKIWMHQEINATQAAEFLGIKRVEFDWILEVEKIEAFGESEFKYGVFKTYRRTDITYLLKNDKLEKLLDIRKKQQTKNRKKGAKKAQKTKIKNEVIKQETKTQIQDTLSMTSMLPPLEAYTSELTFWLRLVSAYADIDHKSSYISKNKFESSTQLFSAKNEALKLLVSQQNPYVTCSFIDCSKTFLCEKCKQECDDFGIRYWEHEGCKKCSLDHHYSLLHTHVKTFAVEADFFTPYPLVQDWPNPKIDQFTKQMIEAYGEIKKPEGYSKKEWALLKSPISKMKIKEIVESQTQDQYLLPSEAKQGKLNPWIALLPLNYNFKYKEELLDYQTIENKNLLLTYSREKSIEELETSIQQLSNFLKQKIAA